MTALLPREQIERLNEMGQSLIFNDSNVVGETGVAAVMVGYYFQDAGKYIDKTVDANTEEGRQFMAWCLSVGVDELRKEGFPAAELIVAVLAFCASYSFGVLENDWVVGDHMPRGTFRYELGMQKDGSALLALFTPFYQPGEIRVLRFTSLTDAVKHVSAGVH